MQLKRSRSSCTSSAAAFVAAELLLLVVAVVAQAPSPSSSSTASWLTLSGDAPLVVAKGGFSGLFPDSSTYAYKFSYIAGSPDTISWCDVRLTKGGNGICLPSILLDKWTDIAGLYPDGKKTYLVNGVSMTGWFPVDYDMTSLGQVFLIQAVLSRTNKFDGSFPINTVDDVVRQIRPAPPLWLNVEHDLFYRQHNLSMRTYVLSVWRQIVPSYISSPEVGFLTSVVSRLKGSKTKLVFRFLGQDVVEPSTNTTYGSLLSNLTFIKTFASGILVPKTYIWPLASNGYLQRHTSVVTDAHNAGLEVFASDFANDAIISYNYSYDPLAEVLSYVDNGIFSVDGVLTDFPITASEAIGCYSQLSTNSSSTGKPFILSHHGASGTYPDCTDLAYQEAVKNGADYIDCPVQVTKDGVLVCMGSINLMDDTTVTTSPFSSPTSNIPKLSTKPGIFTFNLTWEEIQKNLKPMISNPQIDYTLYRNPLYKNAGNFMSLSDFLAFAKDKSISGIVISIENADFLALNLGYDVVDSVIKVLQDSGYRNQTVQDVVIQSTNSSVLLKFKRETKYSCMYLVDESISDADNSSIADIKKFASSVAINKQSVYPETQQFILGQTNIVSKLQTAGFVVYVYLLQNEFVSQPWDFFSDPTVEINSYVLSAGVDGIITDFPGTAAAYKRNSCSKLGTNAPSFMLPVQGGGLLQIMDPRAYPPALAPIPVLQLSDVVEPPLPPAAATSSGGAVPPTSENSDGWHLSASILLTGAMLLGSLLV